jgi:glycerate dehydrogenase
MATSRPHLVVLDGYTLNPGDLSWKRLEAFGTTTLYEYTAPEEVIDRAAAASIVLANKVVLDRPILEALPQLKLIAVTATGYNNIDLEAAADLGITVCNAVGYSTPSVAQHVFALILELTNQVGAHNDSVQQGDWASHRDFSYSIRPIMELQGKTMGIYGFGRIGQEVGAVAQAFGMNVIAHHKHPERDARPGVRFVDMETLFRESDILSLHAPLKAENTGHHK